MASRNHLSTENYDYQHSGERRRLFPQLASSLADFAIGTYQHSLANMSWSVEIKKQILQYSGLSVWTSESAAWEKPCTMEQCY